MTGGKGMAGGVGIGGTAIGGVGISSNTGGLNQKDMNRKN